MNPPARKGLFAGGNFIVDQAKVIDTWPAQDTLARILSESKSNGGGPYNLLKDMSRLSPSMSLEACGLIGEDPTGDWIIEDCRGCGIDVTQLHRTHAAPTPYTDVMNVANTGRRTYFFQKGTSALLEPAHFDFTRTTSRVFFLGYLMLLEKMDQFEGDVTGSAQVLRAAREAGLIAAVDCVSVPSRQFREIVLCAFKETDILFINEFEIGQVLGREVRAERQDMNRAATELVSMASHKESMVVLHAASGAVAAMADGSVEACPSLAVPGSDIAGTTGAGDAFAAGFLLGVHDSFPVDQCLRYAACSAAMSLSHVTPSLGMDTMENCLRLEGEYGYRDF